MTGTDTNQSRSDRTESTGLKFVSAPLLSLNSDYYDPVVCGSYGGGEIWLDSSVVRAFAWYAEGRGSI